MSNSTKVSEKGQGLLQKTLEEIFPPPQCPSCAGELNYLRSNPHVGCGSIMYYECTNCNDLYRENESGILPRNSGLEKIPYRNLEELNKNLGLDSFRF